MSFHTDKFTPNSFVLGPYRFLEDACMDSPHPDLRAVDREKSGFVLIQNYFYLLQYSRFFRIKIGWTIGRTEKVFTY